MVDFDTRLWKVEETGNFSKWYPRPLLYIHTFWNRFTANLFRRISLNSKNNYQFFARKHLFERINMCKREKKSCNFRKSPVTVSHSILKKATFNAAHLVELLGGF
jgi:hypothetical protein